MFLQQWKIDAAEALLFNAQRSAPNAEAFDGRTLAANFALPRSTSPLQTAIVPRRYFRFSSLVTV